jgi:hypothetical protein
MNQSHVIDSWIAELALDARTPRRATAPVLALGAEPEVDSANGNVSLNGRRTRPRALRGRRTAQYLKPCLG